MEEIAWELERIYEELYDEDGNQVATLEEHLACHPRFFNQATAVSKLSLRVDDGGGTPGSQNAGTDTVVSF